ncbi:hypothetical protein Glove_48g134 [Diversispora epigaea]|uniref:Uncharacterized protein n=1 Tax=Diversispora epigaea TaxID=1348612 RepID=A0A397JG75_9GLOM|nr:hypothetical protein Glove_48g134 [Diversispora epigaea]
MILNVLIHSLIPFISKESSTSNLLETQTSKSNIINEIPVEVPSLFIIRILFHETFIKKKNNSIQIEDIEDEIKDYYLLGRQFGIKLCKSRNEIKNKKESLEMPKSIIEYYNAFPSFLSEFFTGMINEVFKKKNYN